MNKIKPKINVIFPTENNHQKDSMNQSIDALYAAEDEPPCPKSDVEQMGMKSGENFRPAGRNVSVIRIEVIYAIQKNKKNKMILVDLQNSTIKKVKKYLQTPQVERIPVVKIVQNLPLQCRICLEEGSVKDIIAPCNCIGSVQYIHQECLKTWILKHNSIDDVNSNQTYCELCKGQLVHEVTYVNSLNLTLLWMLPRYQLFCLCIYFLLSLVFLSIGVYLSSIYDAHGLYQVTQLIGLVMCFIVGFAILVIALGIIIDFMTIQVVKSWKTKSKPIVAEQVILFDLNQRVKVKRCNSEEIIQAS